MVSNGAMLTDRGKETTRVTEQSITIESIIGANVVALREQHKPRMNQDALVDALKARGLEFSRLGVVDVEKGRRSLRVNEMYALADIFEVPLWRLHVPTPDLADRIVELPGGTEIPAWKILTDILHPDTRHAPELYAYYLVTSIMQAHGPTAAVEAIRSAIRQHGPANSNSNFG